MFKKLRLLILGLLTLLPALSATVAVADYGDYPTPEQPSYFQCDKVGELAYNSDVDVLICEVGRNKVCLATSEGGLLCNLPRNYVFRAGDYSDYNVCERVATLSSRGGGGYPLSEESIDKCTIGQGRRAFSFFASSKGGLSI